MQIFPTKTVPTLDANGAPSGGDEFLIVQGGVAKRISLTDLAAAIAAVLPSILASNNTWTGTNDFTDDTTFDAPAVFNDEAQFAGLFDGNDTRLGMWAGLPFGSVPRIAWADGSGSNYQIDVFGSVLRFIKGGGVYMIADAPSNLISFALNLSVGTQAAPDASDTRLSVRGGVAGAAGAMHPTVVIDSWYVLGGASNGFGGSIVGKATDSTTDKQLAGEIQWKWGTATHASRQGQITIGAHDWNTTINNPRVGLTVAADGTNALVGLYAAPPVVQPAAIPAPAGGAVIDVQARAAVAAILNAIGQAAGGCGITA